MVVSGDVGAVEGLLVSTLETLLLRELLPLLTLAESLGPRITEPVATLGDAVEEVYTLGTGVCVCSAGDSNGMTSQCALVDCGQRTAV